MITRTRTRAEIGTVLAATLIEATLGSASAAISATMAKDPRVRAGADHYAFTDLDYLVNQSGALSIPSGRFPRSPSNTRPH